LGIPAAQRQKPTPLPSEPEVQSLVSFVLGRPQILRFLVGRHRVPDPIPLLVDMTKEEPSTRVDDHHIEYYYGEHSFIGSVVSRSIAWLIYIGSDDGGQLD
jgi:hypothetical protein